MKGRELNLTTVEAVHTHTHTSSFIRKEKNKIIGNHNHNGITLVALVVTIVVLLILAGITITYVMGDNSVFKQAQEAKLKADIAKYQEMLETAKGPIIIQGLGKFDKDKYFQAIQDQGIINNKEKDVIDNGDGTYDVTTKPCYVFLVELIPSKENPTDAKIEYLGQAGKIKPIIKKIKASATSNGITGKATVVRLGNGTVEYFYKLSTENDNEYKKMNFISDTEGASINITLQEGATYQVKVVAKNEAGEVTDYATVTIGVKAKTITLSKTEENILPNETIQLTATVLPENAENKEVEWSSSNEAVATVDQEGNVTAVASGTVEIKVKSKAVENVEAICRITVKVPVESVTLNKTTETLILGKNETAKLVLVATVKPDGATNKNVTWKSSDDNIAIVSSKGEVTGKTKGTATITATSEDDKTKTATCTINVTDESDWAEIAKWAKEIAGKSGVTSDTESVEVTLSNGEKKSIKVGDSYYVKYDGKLREVRILGFNHDELVNPSTYGNGATKAGISFEFIECIGTHNMRGTDSSSSTNTDGWAATEMKTYLDSEIQTNKFSDAFKNSVKAVKKQYIKKYNDDTSNNNYSNDKLWLLACSEIYATGYTNGAHAFAITTEGEQYKYYKDLSPAYNRGYSELERRLNGSTYGGWLRSPHCNDGARFACLSSAGYCNPEGALESYNIGGVAPGFCI